MDDPPSPKREDVPVNLDDEEESVPDPDEHILLDGAKSPAWLVKIPKDLVQKWSQIDEDNVHLATVRVYKNRMNESRTRQKMTLILPQPGSSTGKPETFDLDIVRAVPKTQRSNMMVVAERARVPDVGRIRDSILTGTVEYECNLKPVLDSGYRQKIRQRGIDANKPIRTIIRMDSSEDRAQLNQMGGGASQAGRFANIAKSKVKSSKEPFERFARMPRDQLLDTLFSLFRPGGTRDSKPFWSIKDLRLRTQQPEAYLKEILGDIAILYRSGENSGKWGLMDAFKDGEIKAESIAMNGIKHEGGSSIKLESLYSSGVEDDFDDDEDDDEDDDMEEVS